MAQRTKKSVARHVQLELEELQSAKRMPFRQLLDAQRIMAALQRAGMNFRERVFDPLTTLWAFLSQAVASKESSCEDAVSRVLAERVANNQPACSADTSSYCKARGRLTESLISDLARETGQELARKAAPEWLWKGRHVTIVDGSTVEMADTPENQAAYPQSRTQKAGLGFPMMRMVVLISLAVGTVLECAIGPCRGKNSGEQNLFRRMGNPFASNDIVLGDRLYDAYRDIAELKARGVDCVFGKNASRAMDFRRGRRLGPNDHVVVWQRPKYDANRFDSYEQWKSLPEKMEMREIKKSVRCEGRRTRSVIVVTTLLDAEAYAAEEVTDLFALRWHCELDLRSLKQAMGMCRLRCRTPAMVRKELWVYLLAYNLIRVRMAQAAAVHGPMPRSLSLTAAKTHIHNFAPHMKAASKATHDRLEAELLKAIATNQVGQRPGRKEPRAVKKRQQKYSYLTKPRAQARKGLAA